MTSVLPVIGGIEEIVDLIDALVGVMVANVNESLRQGLARKRGSAPGELPRLGSV